MIETTDIEKKSLEAHVELCSERYTAVNTKLGTLDDKISHLCSEIADVKHNLLKLNEKNTDRLIKWGMSVIGVMTLIIGFFIEHFIVK
jgi:chromosome segregation ATPase